MPVASLTAATFTPARTAPLGSATRPRMRPPVPWAVSHVGTMREITRRRQTAVERARSDGMKPPNILGRSFCSKAIACVQPQPCYNPARLEKSNAHCQEEKRTASHRKLECRSARTMSSSNAEPYLKIGDVARRVGVSPSVIRSWESVGLTRPRRTESKYRLYTADDVRLLKRARFLRKVRGLNAAAIVELLRREGRARPALDGSAGAIGTHLRQLRAKRKLSLAQVAQAVNLSVGFLSALERSQMSGSVGTLRKLTRFYKTNILDFFDANGASTRQVRPAQRKVLEAGPGVRMELLAWGNTVMEPHLFRVAPEAGSGDSYTHEGEEFLYVLRGELTIMLENEEYRLKAGDSFYFESATPHHWRNPGRAETWVLWVNTPPTFWVPLPNIRCDADREGSA